MRAVEQFFEHNLPNGNRLPPERLWRREMSEKQKVVFTYGRVECFSGFAFKDETSVVP